MDPRKVQRQFKANRKERKDLAKAQLYIAAQATALLAAWENSFVGRWALSQKPGKSSKGSL